MWSVSQLFRYKQLRYILFQAFLWFLLLWGTECGSSDCINIPTKFHKCVKILNSNESLVNGKYV